MELYFLRHGIAVDRGDPNYPDDRQRPLTREGIRKTHKAAEGIRRLEIEFNQILTSPWLRALQTAEIAAKVLNMENSLEELSELEGDKRVEDLFETLTTRTFDRLLLVGHQPQMGDAISRLLCREGPVALDLKKGGLAAVAVDRLPEPENAQLLWLLTSKQLRIIGE